MGCSMPSFRSFLPLGIIALLVAFYGFNNSIWFTLDTVPPCSASAGHLANYRVILHQLDGSMDAQQLSDYGDIIYAPFYYWATVLMAWVAGDTVFIGMLVNIVFFAGLLMAVYGIGKRLFGQREGLSACVLLSLYPYIYGATRIYIMEIAVCSLATMCVCFLLYSDELRRTWFVVAAAGVCLLGMLTKQTFIIYVAGPLLYMTVKAAVRGHAARNIAILIFAGVVLPIVCMFFICLEGTISLFMMHFQDAPLFSPAEPWARALYYFRLLPDLMNWSSLAVFIPAFVCFAMTKPGSRFFVLIWLLAPLLVLTSAPLKDSKYALPFLPAISLISAWWLYAAIKMPVMRYVLIGVVLIFGIFVQYALLYEISFDHIPFMGGEMRIRLAQYVEYEHSPRNSNLFEVQDALFKVLGEGARPGRINLIGMTENNPRFHEMVKLVNDVYLDSYRVVNEWGMTNYVLQYRLPFIVDSVRKVPPSLVPAEVMRFDLIVTGMPLGEFYPQASRLFNSVATIVVPSDKSKIYVYARNGED